MEHGAWSMEHGHRRCQGECGIHIKHYIQISNHIDTSVDLKEINKFKSIDLS